MEKKYEVISFFTDLRDYDHPYNVGDEFPRHGVTVNEERLAELSSTANKQGRPLIKAAHGPEDQAKEDARSLHTQDDADVVRNIQGQEIGLAERTIYSKEYIETLKLSEIRGIAKELGFKIGSVSKEGAVAEFMEKQGQGVGADGSENSEVSDQGRDVDG